MSLRSVAVLLVVCACGARTTPERRDAPDAAPPTVAECEGLLTHLLALQKIATPPAEERRTEFIAACRDHARGEAVRCSLHADNLDALAACDPADGGPGRSGPRP